MEQQYVPVSHCPHREAANTQVLVRVYPGNRRRLSLLLAAPLVLLLFNENETKNVAGNEKRGGELFNEQ